MDVLGSNLLDVALQSERSSLPNGSIKTNLEKRLIVNPSKSLVEKRLLHKYIHEDQNRKMSSALDQLKIAKFPFVITGGLAIVLMLMGHGIIGLLLFSLGSLFVIRPLLKSKF